MTYREAIAQGEQKLNQVGIVEAKNDAWLLLAMVCKIDHTFYYMHMDEEMTEEQLREFCSVIRKRAERVPLQYITGEQEFMGLSFHVNSDVLIPRQDTETLVEAALKQVRSGMKIMDMCTGSGCVLISILRHSHGVTGFGYDISKQAIKVAKENARRHDVAAVFERSNLFDEVAERDFDMIVANPPYIPTAEIVSLMPEVSQFEPVKALDGHEDGLFFYKEMLKECANYLKPQGSVLFEIGCEQGAMVSAMLKYAGYSDVRIVKDLAHRDRVVMGYL
ncbi:MAG: peptide chain release factor N(5)-glutamine methyltransferase [Muribaculaceae bacterium]|nr:peptide chain release factor N(5)-glutamine methyltransferase [Roseburia sp.]MCM1431277.1 peptide chain release factor N(5)-glutamine methyltransferase [Muribaculaceae bacterium]MCM1492237.1 peptide chain release factor N(5)-glutamine methyltransferase [Muribaculaceae bacterium]